MEVKRTNRARAKDLKGARKGDSPQGAEQTTTNRHEMDLGTILITSDDLDAVRKGLERSARIPEGRLQQRMG